MRRISTLLVASVALASPALAQDLTVKAPPQAKPIAITGATVHTVSGATIANGYVIFDQGKITAVGDAAALPRLTADVELIAATGKHVYPGLIAAYSQIGLTEIGAVRASDDMSEVGSDGVMPEVRAAVAVNPDSTLIPVTRSNGVLAAGVFPVGGSIPGRASVMLLDGWTWEQMCVKDAVGLVVNWPMSRTINAWWMQTSEAEQQTNIRRGFERIENTFATAKSYAAARAADPASPADLRWEAMRPVFAEGAAQSPVFVMAQDYDQITAAVAFCARTNLKCVIVGGRDAVECAPLLKARDIAVVVIGTHVMPARDDAPFDAPFTLPARLEAAGVRWCLASGEETPHERNLPYNAARAVAYGLDHDAAIKAITLSTAQILGVADALGSIEPGKSATLLLTDGTPLETTTRIEAAFVQGKRIDLSNKQTELNRKYREKYRQMGPGTTSK
jgi:imidazolonepropionase-like amidohydrolase